MASFVTYLRVSTDQQGRSGLGLEAQRAAVVAHAAATGGAIVAEFVEVEVRPEEQSARSSPPPWQPAAPAGPCC